MGRWWLLLLALALWLTCGYALLQPGRAKAAR